MAGDGLASDSSNNIYFLDGNGTFDPTLNVNGFPTQGDFGTPSSSSPRRAMYWLWRIISRRYTNTYENDNDLDLGFRRASLSCPI